MAEKLTGPDRDKTLAPLLAGGWRLDEDESGLTKDFRFKDFAAAFGWMTSIAIEADKLDHHPEWTNVYNRVSVRLSTHDAGGLTALDVALGTKMDERAA